MSLFAHGAGPTGRCWDCAPGSWFAALLACCLLSAALGSRGLAAADLIERGTYDAAIQGIPFDRLTDSAQARLWKIVSQPSIYRRLPTSTVTADPKMYLFLIRHPEVIVNMWDLMGVTKVQLQRTSDFQMKATDGAGTTGNAELIYGDRETHVLIGDGFYEGPVLKRKIPGQCLLVLKSGYGPEAGPKTLITHRLDMFLQLDNIGADLVAKTLHPLVGKSTDHNFVEATRFLGQVSQAAETRQLGMQQLAGRLTKVEPPIRDRFATISAAIFAQSNPANATMTRSTAQTQPASMSASVEERKSSARPTRPKPAR